MAINIQDISILIPSYGRAKMTLNAVRCAMKINVKEVLVSDDASGINLFELLEEFIEDKKLKIYHQSQNLGLWQNHLFLLKQASGNWIKFLQTDDEFSNKDLDRLCKWASQDTALLAIEPRYKFENKEVVKMPRLQQNHIYAIGKFNTVMAKKGNIAGRPSYCLYNKRLMALNTSFWANNISADLVQNWYLGNKGKIILLTRGEVYCGIHDTQDGNLQSFNLIYARLNNSLNLIKSSSQNNESRIFFKVYGLIEFIGLFISIVFSMVRNKKAGFTLFFKVFFKFFQYLSYCFITPKSWKFCIQYFNHKYFIK